MRRVFGPLHGTGYLRAEGKAGYGGRCCLLETNNGQIAVMRVRLYNHAAPHSMSLIYTGREREPEPHRTDWGNILIMALLGAALAYLIAA